MKTRIATICLGISMALAFAISLPGTAAAQSSAPTPAHLLVLIEAQQKQLDELKAALLNAQKKADEAATKADKAEKSSSQGLAKSIDIGGAIEIEATSAGDFNNADTSDITLAKVELFVDVTPSDYLSTHVQLVYEDDGDESINLDEAFATLGNTEKFPLYLQAGKWAMPFGGFDTAMSTDPLTKSLGETKEAGILLGVTWQGLTLEGFVYNGDTQKSGEGDNIDQFGLALGYAKEFDKVAFSVGAGYLNNIADSDGLTTGLDGNSTALGSYVRGYEVHGSIALNGFTVRGGLMKANAFNTGELVFNNKGASPEAWNAEVSYATPIAGKDVTFAATIQGTDEALALALPESRFGGALTVGILDNVAVTVEFIRDEDYATSVGGTGRNGHTTTLKLAAEF